VLGEGNTSARIDDVSFFVKASGSQLSTINTDQFTRVRSAPILDALGSSREYGDADVKKLLLDSCVDSAGKMPSVETLLHAYLLSLRDVAFVGHTHVTTINGLMCSERGWQTMLAGGRMFPDEIVVCGEAPCCVRYVDPGLPLARELRSQVERYIDDYGMWPKSIYMQNHGFIAVGRSSKEVESITIMADKAARVMLGAMACGGPAFLSPENVRRIATRPDEHYRQKAIGLTQSSAEPA
jgi:rhamnose utilization protein RhaD (predicted bifunctional aldolase and dehydrogenase)